MADSTARRPGFPTWHPDVNLHIQSEKKIPVVDGLHNELLMTLVSLTYTIQGFASFALFATVSFVDAFFFCTLKKEKKKKKEELLSFHDDTVSPPEKMFIVMFCFFFFFFLHCSVAKTCQFK